MHHAMRAQRLLGQAFWARLVTTRERYARRAEKTARVFPLPADLSARADRDLPNDAGRQIEVALREWFICCAWSDFRLIGMPSRLVDEAWRAFIEDSESYTEFCRAAFGWYLPQIPELGPPYERAPLDNTVWAWDQSLLGAEHESALWSLDSDLGIEEPWGLAPERLITIRAGKTYANGTPFDGPAAVPDGTGFAPTPPAPGG